jgi:hypothetical protein
VRELAAALGDTHPTTLAIGAGSVTLLLILKRIARRVPYKYNNGKVKENKCFTFSNIDEALTQMDRLTNYGELEDNSKVVVLKQGASENNERVLKTWFKGETTLNTRSIYG